MPSDNLFRAPHERHTFFVLGTHLPQTNSEEPILQLLLPYYQLKENFCFLSHPFVGSVPVIYSVFENIHSANKVIISNHLSLSEDVIRPEDFKSSSNYDFILFDNIIKPEMHIDCHFSIFIDYTHLADLSKSQIYDSLDPNWYKSLFASLFSPESNITLICTPPPKRKISFVFARIKDEKERIIEQLEFVDKSAVYIKDSVCLDEKYKLIYKECEELRFNRVIISEIDIERIEYILNRVADIVIVYSVEDFGKIHSICELFKKRNIKIPEHIIQIAEKSKTKIN